MERVSGFAALWLQLELCALAVLMSRGEIRCYCDAPHCVATGYMCKSELNSCFTRILEPHSAKSPLSHGCSEPQLNPASVCGSETLECCHEDMCNYRGLQELTHSHRENTDRRIRPVSEGNRHHGARLQDTTSAREVWFRAAVIAVPIAGGLVLLMLVVLAARMLRHENRRLQQQRRETLARLQHGFLSARHPALGQVRGPGHDGARLMDL